MEKLSTGIEGLDTLLYGGLIKGRPYLVQGKTGTGKTTLAIQFLLKGIEEGENGLYISFEESKRELIENMESFGWDISKIRMLNILPSTSARKWTIPGLESFKNEDFFDMLSFIESLRIEIEKHDIKRVAIDSLTLFSVFQKEDRDVRREVLMLMNTLLELGCTTILTSEMYTERVWIENVLARGIIVLYQEGERRYLEIEKMRGQDFIPGKHSLKITSEGIKVFPRLALEDQIEVYENRVCSGVEGLDKMCNGGFLQGDAVLVIGSAGSGKTVLGLQFLNKGARNKEKGLFISLSENASQLRRNARNFGIDLEELEGKGLVKLLYLPPQTADIDEHVDILKREIKGISRVVVDSISDYETVLPPLERKEFLASLISIFKRHGITSLLTSESKDILGSPSISDEGEAFVVDTIIVLRYVEIESEMRKALNILKMRGSNHDKEIREYTIGEKGIEVMFPFKEYERIFTGSPRKVRLEEALAEAFRD